MKILTSLILFFPPFLLPYLSVMNFILCKKCYGYVQLYVSIKVIVVIRATKGHHLAKKDK